MKGLCGHSAENPGDLSQTVVLCNLEGVDQALLSVAGVPNLGPVCKHRDDQGIVDLVPVEEVEATDGVAKDADPMDGGMGAVGHDLDVRLPVKVAVDEHPQKAEGGGGGDVLGT